MIKKLVTKLIQYGVEEKQNFNIYFALSDHEIYNLFYFASELKTCDQDFGYSHNFYKDLLNETYDMLIDIAGCSRVGVLYPDNDFVGW